MSLYGVRNQQFTSYINSVDSQAFCVALAELMHIYTRNKDRAMPEVDYTANIRYS